MSDRKFVAAIQLLEVAAVFLVTCVTGDKSNWHQQALAGGQMDLPMQESNSGKQAERATKQILRLRSG